jgi:hypothetical protein
MAALRAALLVAVSAAIGGCSVHPIPDDVTGNTTLLIVRKVRCEARYAIQSELARILEETEAGVALAAGKPVRDFKGEFDRNPMLAGHPQNIALVSRYWSTAIAFKFRFNITENNNATISSSFADPFTRGLFTLGLVGGNERQRLNERIFTLTDTFGELFTDLAEDECEAHRMIGTNWIYPVVGRTGMDETIRTFFALDGEADFDTEGNTFVDRRLFQTKFFFNADPTLTFTALPADTGAGLRGLG